MSILFTNNASGSLSVEVDGAAPGPESTTLTLQSNEASLFPPVSSLDADFFYATLEDSAGNIEIVKVTDNNLGSDIFTVERGQENTTSQDFAVGSKVECRPTAGTFNEFVQRSGAVITGLIDFNGNELRDPVITSSGVAEIKGVFIRGADGGTANQLVVPASGGAPSIGGFAITHAGNDSAYVKNTRSITGISGISGGGDLSADRQLALSILSLGFQLGKDIAADDRFLVVDAGTNVHKQMRYRDAAVPVVTKADLSYTATDDDMNRYFRMTNATGEITFNVDNDVGDVGSVIIIEQTHATNQVVVSGSATINSAFSLNKTRQQYSVIVLVCVTGGASAVWTLYGDAVQ